MNIFMKFEKFKGLINLKNFYWIYIVVFGLFFVIN